MSCGPVYLTGGVCWFWSCPVFIFCLLCSRLSQELPQLNEQEMSEDSLDEIYLTPSIQRDLSDCHQPYSGTLSSLDDQLRCSALDVACEYSNLKATKLQCLPRQPPHVFFLHLVLLRHAVNAGRPSTLSLFSILLWYPVLITIPFFECGNRIRRSFMLRCS